MEIYIEYVILDNLSVDILLLLVTGRILRFSLRKWRLLLAGLAGTGFALLSPYLRLPGLLLFLIKAGMGIAVYWIGCGQRRRNLQGLAVFFAATFLFGGICMGAFYLFHIEFNSGAAVTYAGIPIGFVIVPVLIAFALCERLNRLLRKKKDIHPFVKTVRVVYKGRTCELQAFVDSGNRLYRDGDPVCIIDYRGVTKLMEDELVKLFAGKGEGDYILFQNFDGKKTKLLSFYADRLDILDKDDFKSWTRVCFAVVMKEFCDTEPYDVLLSPALV